MTEHANVLELDLPEIADRDPYSPPTSHLEKTGAETWSEVPGRRESRTLLVNHMREAVDTWRERGDPGATDTTRRLLAWWFEEDHRLPGGGPFRYYSRRNSPRSWTVATTSAGSRHWPSGSLTSMCSTFPAPARCVCTPRISSRFKRPRTGRSTGSSRPRTVNSTTPAPRPSTWPAGVRTSAGNQAKRGATSRYRNPCSGTFSQTFDTQVGWLYTVHFAMAGNTDGGPATKLLKVVAGDEGDQFSFNQTAWRTSVAQAVRYDPAHLARHPTGDRRSHPAAPDGRITARCRPTRQRLTGERRFRLPCDIASRGNPSPSPAASWSPCSTHLQWRGRADDAGRREAFSGGRG